MSFCPCAQRRVSVPTELTFGHLCYYLTDVPPQPNSPSGLVSNLAHKDELRPEDLNSPILLISKTLILLRNSFPLPNQISERSAAVVVFQGRQVSHLCYTCRDPLPTKLESSSTGSSFPAKFAKTVPLAVGSLECEQRQRESR